MVEKDNVYFLNRLGSKDWKNRFGNWELSDGSFLYSEDDLIFTDNNWNYYRHTDINGYITYLKKKLNYNEV